MKLFSVGADIIFPFPSSFYTTHKTFFERYSSFDLHLTLTKLISLPYHHLALNDEIPNIIRRSLFWVSFVGVVALGGFGVFFSSLCIDVAHPAHLVLGFAL